jgi:hypothetical protein
MSPSLFSILDRQIKRRLDGLAVAKMSATSNADEIDHGYDQIFVSNAFTKITIQSIRVSVSHDAWVG